MKDSCAITTMRPTSPEALRQLSAEQAATLPPLLHSLWHDAHGDWASAHALAQDVDTADGARVHAYLHRKEDDTFNANYWYRRTGQPAFTGLLEDEWTAIVTAFL
jgi:hypothetical protein